MEHMNVKQTHEENLDGSDTRMLRACLNKSWKPHSTKIAVCTAIYLSSHKTSK